MLTMLRILGSHCRAVNRDRSKLCGRARSVKPPHLLKTHNPRTSTGDFFAPRLADLSSPPAIINRQAKVPANAPMLRGAAVFSHRLYPQANCFVIQNLAIPPPQPVYNQLLQLKEGEGGLP